MANLLKKYNKPLNKDYRVLFQQRKISFICNGGDDLAVEVTAKHEDDKVFRTIQHDITDIFTAKSESFKNTFKAFLNDMVHELVTNKIGLQTDEKADFFESGE